MWLLVNNGDTETKGTLLNIESGKAILLKVKEQEGTILFCRDYAASRGSEVESINIGVYQNPNDASQVFKRIAMHLKARDLADPMLGVMEY